MAVVILNWNGAALMERFLPSVVRYSPEEIAEVVVADNGSTDDSLRILAEKFPSVRVVRFTQNYGFAEGYNRALQQIDVPYAVLLNSDVEVTPGWLEAPIHRLDASPEVAAVQPKLLAERERDRFEYAGAAGGFMDKYGYPFCRGRIFQEVETDREQYDAEVDILWATGACLLSVQMFIGPSVGWTQVSLPTRRKSICVGGCGHADIGWYARLSRWFTMWVVERFTSRVRVKPFSISAITS